MTHLVSVACSRIVHEDIDLVPELYCLVNGSLPVFGLSHVHSLEGESLGGGRNLLTGLRVEVADQDLGPLLGEVLRDALAKAAGSAFRSQVLAFEDAEEAPFTYR